VLVLVLAGCGGSDGGDASRGQRADAICDRAEQAIRKVGAPEDTADLARVTARASVEVRAATAEIKLEQLGPAGKAQLRALEGVGRNLHAPEGQPS
jgi:hypothetical protein